MENLKEIRNELLRLHKTLMEIEKANYEAENGKTSPTQLLQLLFDNERFTWLRTISILVTELDELFANKQGFDEELAEALLVKVSQLLDESENFSDFKSKYQANLDTERIVTIHHNRLLNLLQKKEV